MATCSNYFERFPSIYLDRYLPTHVLFRQLPKLSSSMFEVAVLEVIKTEDVVEAVEAVEATDEMVVTFELGLVLGNSLCSFCAM